MQSRAAEQANARNALTGALTGVRGQDIDTAQSQANLDQARNANNLNAQVTTTGQNQDWQKALLQGQLTAMGQGTTAATGGVTAAEAGAAGENKAKGGLLSSVGGLIAAL
jgi:hypothetical protein